MSQLFYYRSCGIGTGELPFLLQAHCFFTTADAQIMHQFNAMTCLDPKHLGVILDEVDAWVVSRWEDRTNNCRDSVSYALQHVPPCCSHTFTMQRAWLCWFVAQQTAMLNTVKFHLRTGPSIPGNSATCLTLADCRQSKLAAQVSRKKSVVWSVARSFYLKDAE